MSQLKGGRKLKKFWTIFLCILTLVAVLTGCSSSPTAKSDNDTPPDIKAIKERGVLKVGVKVDVPKFGYKDPQTGNIEGMEIDLAKMMAKKILGDENKIAFQGVNSKTRGPLLDNGEIDMIIATFTITDERKKSYNFSEPYFTDGIALMVKKASGIQSLQDLSGKRIGVSQSTTTKKSVQEEADRLGIKVSFLEFSTYPEIKSALDAGRIDCFANDGSVLVAYLDDSTVLLPDRFSPQEYGVATKRSNEALAKVAGDIISGLRTSGEMDKLIQKWGIK